MKRPAAMFPRWIPISLAGALLLSVAACSGHDSATGSATISAALPAQTVNNGEPVDWPRWRGVNLDGISPEGGWSTDWPADGPPIVWRTNVGIGFSSVSVVGGRVYTMGHTPGEEGTEEERSKQGTDSVLCLDAATGDVVWTHSYPCRRAPNMHEGGPAATPTVQDNRVYTVSKEGHFFCLDAETGDVVWQRMFETDLGVKMPTWGFACSPLVVKNLVIVDGGRTAAYDAQSGEIVWKTGKFKPGYGSVVDFELALGDRPPERFVAVLNNECLIVLRLADGEEIARQAWKTDWATNSTTPVVVGDQIFISTGYKRGCLLARITEDRLQTIYENKNMSNHFNNCVLWDGCWYGFNGNSNNRRNVTLRCLDYETSDVKWEQRGLGCGSLMVAGGNLLCLSDRGELVVVDPSPDGYREIARAKVLDGKCWTVPVLSGGRIYARNAKGDLVSVDVSLSSDSR